MPKTHAPKPPPGLPTREQILDFIATSDTPAGKREIAKAFGLTAQQKITLKAMLKDMADDGLIDSAPGRAFHKMGGVPKVTVLRIVDADDGGNVWAVPENWHADTPAPRLRVRERKHGALAIGDRVLARTEEAGNGWIAHPMKALAKGEELILGVLRQEGGKLWLQGVEKKERREFQVSDAGEGKPGDLVLAEKAGRPPRITARVTEVLGDPFAPRSFSMIAIHKLGIPTVFTPETIAEAERVARTPLGKDSEDLRHIPIVAIDPADARDHDDAVWAAPDDDPKNEGGWKAIVAIADVSFYVRPGSDLDREARRRGNSVYFPDRVVPMLPEVLSADVCSLKEGADRAALVCHLQVSKAGELKSWRFSRALVRIAANIAYEDAQAAIDGVIQHPLTETALRPLWACWRALYAAREKRSPLDLDLPERRVMLDEKGRIMSVAPRERLDAHKLIEDYMIAANVAAAKALEAKKAPVMYRVHEEPSREKLVALKDYLKTFGVEFALGQVVRPATFNHILDKVGEVDFRQQVMEQVLRTQTQAYYAPANHGHFGLALGSYAHFTSPIRRYADLIVHRSLVSAYKLGDGGLTEGEAAGMERIGEGISALERRAMEAERDTIDRYVAAFLSEKVGEVLDARITGVTNFGFFATVEGIGGDGLMPARDIGGEYFRFDEAARKLIGDQTGTEYASGQRLPLRLAEANPVSGALRFEMVDGKGARVERDERPGRVIKRRGRPANIRHQGRKR
ncbi:VacB/RNase II family 3'-5' exoribonuclease [Sphingomonas sp. So64.6b]|uniref:ribonuclease R family protein n=1 Tax=Sphingomonas sp. So64.6b TaxID=2997354 RepID=UPI0015FFDB33|nr:VacB/RNase II family 3'-5' exoribonuclease [Sphingomonas sp. So64.6b]QNA83347.1 VacB/RNase II family 3'-5' exoribonuclease [Sphingomonas sp. So64.6b]